MTKYDNLSINGAIKIELILFDSGYYSEYNGAGFMEISTTPATQGKFPGWNYIIWQILVW